MIAKQKNRHSQKIWLVEWVHVALPGTMISELKFVRKNIH